MLRTSYGSEVVNSTRQSRRTVILGILKDDGGLLTSRELTRALTAQGYEFSERTVRLYLQELDSEGLTENFGRRGRKITPKGLAEFDAAQTLSRVGFLSAKIDQMAYRMSFDLARRTGTIVVNTGVVDPNQLTQCLDRVCRVFEQGYAMGHLAGLIGPGETLGNTIIPEGLIGFCTVCSITLNGVLLKHGVPTHSRFGGLLELVDGRALRFLEMITYDGTTIDPLEVFIRSAMTDYLGAISSGNGRIGASFREIPADSCSLVADLAEKLAVIGLGGFMKIGQPGRELLGIPVSEGRAGAIVIGGLNPMAIFEELGMRVRSHALSGLLEYNRLFPYQELHQRLASLRATHPSLA